MNNLTPEQELAKLRAQKKKKSIYVNQYAKDKYKRLTCLLPIEKYDTVKKAIGDDSISSYIISLMDKDLKEKGLL